jgi:CBS domain-containing protein
VKLRDFLSADLAVVPLAGEVVSAVAEELSERLIGAGRAASPERLRARVAEGKPQDAIVLGSRAVLIHYRTDAVRELCTVIGTTRQPLRRNEGEGGDIGARIALFIAIPYKDASRYVQLLGAFARLLSREDVVRRMLEQQTPDELVALEEFGEYEVPDQLTVRELMSEHPRVTGPDVALSDAALQLVRSGVGALPVVDGERRVVGMLSERELLRQLVRTLGGGDIRPDGQSGRKALTVRDVMTRQVLCVAPEQPVAEVAALMVNKDVDRVPVARRGELVGFLTRGDIVRKLIGS